LEMIHNARQCYPASSEKRLRVEVVLTLMNYTGPEWVRLEVSDNGCGVPPEYKEKIFEQFFSRRPHGEVGTGLGLFYVRRVVRAHGGTIREAGQFGKGARFIIELPRYHTGGLPSSYIDNGEHP